MTSIPVAIWAFSDNKFKGLYLKKEEVFFYFLLHFLNVRKIQNILKKEEYPSLIISEIMHSKEMFS